MQQEKRSLCQSFAKMSVEGFSQRNSSSCSKPKSHIYMTPQQVDSAKIIKAGNKDSELFNQLLKSDPYRPFKIVDQSEETNENFIPQENQLKLMRSDEGDKKKLQEIIQSEIFRIEHEQIETAPSHDCWCAYSGDQRYWPNLCVCYDNAEMCSKKSCFHKCYKTKIQRLKNKCHPNISSEKLQEDFLKIVGCGRLNPNPINQGVLQSKVYHCKCRKTQCLKGYCICKNKNEECDEDCGCELPCKNRAVPAFLAPERQNPATFLYSSSSSLNSSGKQMKFDEPNFS